MIVFTRVASIAPGKMGAAMGFAHEIAGYMKSAYGVDLEILSPIGGNPSRIAWVGRYADMAAMDKVSAAILQDKQYWAIVNKAADLMLPGSAHDTIWRTA